MGSKNDKFTYPAAQNEPGPVCVKLLTTLRGIQQGKIEDKQGWLFKVERF
jgi:branched-chain amino acid aminotransferase